MTQVTFWNNNNKGGLSDTFNGAQGVPSGLSSIDCLETQSSTWLIVYNSNDYQGDYMKVGPSTYLSDLNHVDRMGGGDWKNQIQSCVIYGSQPSWWNNSGTPPIDVPVGATQAFFSENDNFAGDNRVFTANVNESDLNNNHYTTDSGKDMKNNINSIKTGSSAWLQIWDETDYTGNFLQIYPNTSYKNLDEVKRGSSGDWQNQIQSFNLYNSLPASWNLGFDSSAFIKSFPNEYASSDMDGTYYVYNTQDAPYHIHLLGTTYPSTSTMNLSFKVCYDTAGKNDKVYLDILINADGTYNSLTYSYESGGAIQIPSSVIKAVDVSAELLGAIGALESAGISEAAAQEFVETFDTICKAFNKISSVVYKLSEANDGRFYLVPVVCQVVNRALNAITISN